MCMWYMYMCEGRHNDVEKKAKLNKKLQCNQKLIVTTAGAPRQGCGRKLRCSLAARTVVAESMS